MPVDKERMARLGWRFHQRFRQETGYEEELYKCERCEDTGFLYSRIEGMSAATPCTCKLRKKFAECDDEKLVRRLDELLQRTERRYLSGELMQPSKIAKLEYEEWLASSDQQKEIKEG